MRTFIAFDFRCRTGEKKRLLSIFPRWENREESVLGLILRPSGHQFKSCSYRPGHLNDHSKGGLGPCDATIGLASCVWVSDSVPVIDMGCIVQMSFKGSGVLPPSCEGCGLQAISSTWLLQGLLQLLRAVLLKVKPFLKQPVSDDWARRVIKVQPFCTGCWRALTELNQVCVTVYLLSLSNPASASFLPQVWISSKHLVPRTVSQHLLLKTQTRTTVRFYRDRKL